MLENREGEKVPEVTFRTREGNEWKDVTTDDLFAGKNVVVFALPGAFTPTCSSTHLPRYNELAPVFKANGIDEIICLSVNDGFVMNAWAGDQDANNIRFIPDGNGEFSEKMGMPVIYLSPESMLRGFEKSGIDRDRLCTYCIGGSHPYSHCGNVELTAQPQSNQLEMVMAK